MSIFTNHFIKKVNFFFKNHKIFENQEFDATIFKKKKILVAGGAGSIGSCLVEKLAKFDVKKIVVLDNSEYGIFSMKQTLENNKLIDYRFMSILNRKDLARLFKNEKFDFVYNCAAIKHVDIAEENPLQAKKINVEGNLNLANLSIKNKIKQFIFISSDKALLPKGVMGKTKLLSEKKLLQLNFKDTLVKILRFPNVLLTKGSILEIIYNCIIHKKVFLLRTKDIKRYFVFDYDAILFILLSTNQLSTKKVIVLKNVKETKILDIVIYLKKFYKFKYKVTTLPKFEKIKEEYENFNKNKLYLE